MNYSYLGKNVHANNSQLSLPASTPAAVTSAISGVIGIDQGTAIKHTADTEPGPPPGARFGVQPCSAYSPLLAGVVAVASQAHHHPLGFINPLYYKLLGTSALHDIVAPTSPVAQVRTEYVNGVDNSQGKLYKLQTVDVQSSTLHDTPGYDDETGVGTPPGPRFSSAVSWRAPGAGEGVSSPAPRRVYRVTAS